MTVKLVALDLDGTLLNARKRVAPAVRREIERAAARGVAFAFATGRSIREMDEILPALPCVDYALTCNGAYLYDLRANAAACVGGLEMEQVRALNARLLPFAPMVELFAEGEILTDARALASLKRYDADGYRALILRTRTGVEDFGGYLLRREAPVGKLHCIFFDSAARDRALRALEGAPFDITHQERSNLEINRQGVNKGSGLAALAARLGLEAREVMAVGDNDNDISMLRYAGVPVAMGNALPFVKACAGRVTRSNDQDGVAWALKAWAGE